MKKINSLTVLQCFGLAVVFCFVISCNSNSGKLTADESALVKDSLNRMAANIQRDISANGPKAWLNYFENDPGFFMVSDGGLAFKDYPTAKAFVADTLPKYLSKVTLTLKNVKVDPLTSAYAILGADYHEDLVFSNASKVPANGYLTATAHFDGKNWKLRNLSWSNKPPAK